MLSPFSFQKGFILFWINSKPVFTPEQVCHLLAVEYNQACTIPCYMCVRIEQRRFGTNSLWFVVEQLIQILFKYFLYPGSHLLFSACASCSLNLRGTTQERRSFSEGQRRSVHDALFSLRNANNGCCLDALATKYFEASSSPCSYRGDSPFPVCSLCICIFIVVLLRSI